MSVPLDIVAGAAAGLAVLVFFAGLAYWRRTRARVARLKSFVAAQQRPPAETEGATPKAKGPQSEIVLAMNRRLRAGSYGQQVQREINRAGLAMTASEFILLRAGATLIGLVVGMVLTPRPVSGFGLLIPLAGGLIGFAAPKLYLNVKQQRRLNAFEKQFPDALDVLAGSLRAGSSLLQAMEMVSREMEPPLAGEFARIVHEVGLGLPLEGALADTVDRVPSDDLDMLATAINIQHRTGGNLAEIVASIAVTIRERMRVKGEIRTLTAQQRISAYIITALPFVLMAVLFVINRPYMMKLFDPGVTRCLAVGAAVCMVTGALALRRITAIEV